MKEAILYEKLKNKKVRCQVCQRRCTIAPGQTGFCQTRLNKNGKLYTIIYSLVSSLNVDPIEKKPVFHFKPGTDALSLGTFGCNFRCKFCQNWQISYANASELTIQNGQPKAGPPLADQMKVPPKEAIKIAQKENCPGLAFTYNEPAIWLEYCLDVSRLAKNLSNPITLSDPGSDQVGDPGSSSKGLYTVWVTNGYATKKAIDKIAPFLDVYRVDLKSFDDKFYQKLIAIPGAGGIFENTQYVHDQYPKIHIECITNIIPGWNDSDKTLKSIARWIKKNLGPKTPWHVTRFFPAAQMQDTPPTPPETLIKAQKIGFKQGLHFVYLGNMITEKGENTYCPKCGSLNIKRTGYMTEILAVENKKGRGYCSKCGEDLNLTSS